MLNHFGIPRKNFSERLRNNWTLEKALTTPIAQTAVDHTGRVFNSAREMCESWGLDYSQYRVRLGRGWSLERILTTKVENLDTRCRDHLGNEFSSETQRAKHYGVASSTVRHRMSKQGMSLEQALTTKSLQGECEDYLGNKFRTMGEMLSHYDVSAGTWTKRSKTWAMEEILRVGVIPGHSIKKLYTGIDGTSYFSVRVGKHKTTVMSLGQLEEYKHTRDVKI